eukprot:PhM_4_TR5246/c0_g1_i1/m.54367
MLRRGFRLLQIHQGGQGIDSPTFFARPNNSPMAQILHSPYMEAFKEYWATPVEYLDRDFGEKPKPGDPVPAFDAASMVVLGRNKYGTAAEDYKVLLLFREAKGRYTKDNFIIPGLPVMLPDRDYEEWVRTIRLTGGGETPGMMEHRVAALRALIYECNIMVTPDGLGEIEGPPGLYKWQSIITADPGKLVDLTHILNLPMARTLNRFQPLVRIVTPKAEKFRYKNTFFVCPFDKMADLRYVSPTNNEEMCWVSPSEAMERHALGLMEMPTPTYFLMTMLAEYKKLDDILAVTEKMQGAGSVQEVPMIEPEIHYKDDGLSIITLPGDELHSTSQSEDAIETKGRRRVEYFKDYPFGVRFEWQSTFGSVVVPDTPAELKARRELLEAAHSATMSGSGPLIEAVRPEGEDGQLEDGVEGEREPVYVEAKYQRSVSPQQLRDARQQTAQLASMMRGAAQASGAQLPNPGSAQNTSGNDLPPTQG